MKKELTRRDFLKISALAVGGAFLSACGIDTDPEKTKLKAEGTRVSAQATSYVQGVEVGKAQVAQPTAEVPATAVPTRVEAMVPTPTRVTATKLANPNVAPTTAPAVRPANLSSPEGRAAAMRTAQEVYNLLYQPCKTEIVGCYDLQVSEITPEKSAEGRIVGWRVARERDARQNFIPPFFVRLPEDLGMQFGFMHLKSDRNTLGLTASEANMLGYQANHVGSGIPSGEIVPVEGFTIYFDMSGELGKLTNQIGPQRRVSRQ